MSMAACTRYSFCTRRQYVIARKMPMAHVHDRRLNDPIDPPDKYEPRYDDGDLSFTGKQASQL